MVRQGFPGWLADQLRGDSQASEGPAVVEGAPLLFPFWALGGVRRGSEHPPVGRGCCEKKKKRGKGERTSRMEKNPSKAGERGREALPEPALGSPPPGGEGLPREGGDGKVWQKD
jgi:hypothetical protein